ncbi:M48 family metallopeptidase [Rhizobium metallidurans]|uniref:Zn-dependent protease with chaperone function n=1 Tax=Rhizobium metallidurans TaxID=1265931 RepID=A0A7W6GCH3_9HYPH|nr:M48 family metallopeptidase [Rhizobium metallidurans]MBB3966773.1 Zn-dependent protease with chaperone function [Rhizobium metallidurans]
MAASKKTNGAAKPRIPASVILIFWLIVLPLALIGLGLWQLDRAGRTQLEIETASRDMATSLGEVRSIAAATPNRLLRFDNGRSYPASMALAELEKAAGENDLLLWVSAVRQPFGYLTIAGGALALAGGFFGLLAPVIAGRRARKSRDQLVRSFARLRRALPFMMAALMLGLGFSGVGATIFETMTLPFWGDISSNAIKLAVAGIILAGVALYCAVTAVQGLRRVFALVEPEPIVERAREMTEQQAPALWSFVGKIAARMNTSPPDTIILGMTSGFYVTESPVRLIPDDRLIKGRTLHMPAPLLELLDTAEISAIVGHELAHFAGEDTRYSQRFVPIYSSMQRSLGALYQADINGDFGVNAALRLGHHALSSFDTAVAHWSRLREFEADRIGSMVSGPDAAASALVRSQIADAAVGFILEQAFRGDGEFGPDLVNAASELVVAQGFVDPTEHLEERQPHPTDSHPPTIQRIRALGVEVNDALISHATRRPDGITASFGQRALPDWSGFCRDLSAEFQVNAENVRAEHRGELETTAAGVTETELVLYENTNGMAWAMVVIAMLFGAFLASTYLFPVETGFANQESHRAILTAGIGAGILLCAAFFISFRRRARKPLMVLTPDTLQSPWLREPVRWETVVGYQVHAANRLALQMWIGDGLPLPQRTRFSFYNKIKRKQRIVELDALGIRGMKAAEFSDLIGRYVNAAHARNALSGIAA